MAEFNLEGYKIVRMIGKGGMGTVYEGVQLSLNRRVAIKEILDQFLDTKEFRERFIKEAHIMAALNHEYIAKVYELLKEKYIIMEYIEGNDLFDLIKTEKKLDQKRAIGIIAKVAEGLEAAHEEGIVHRDIKPQNIKITKRDKPKIMDFGIAKAHDSTQTVTGAVMGTFAYMSPEQALGKHLDGKSDVYSLGITLYQAITGQLPFKVDTDYDYLFKHRMEAPIPPSQMLSTIHPELEKVILNVLQKNPADRYSAGEFAAKLNDIAKMPESDKMNLKSSETLSKTIFEPVDTKQPTAPQTISKTVVNQIDEPTEKQIPQKTVLENNSSGSIPLNPVQTESHTLPPKKMDVDTYIAKPIAKKSHMFLIFILIGGALLAGLITMKILNQSMSPGKTTPETTDKNPTSASKTIISPDTNTASADSKNEPKKEPETTPKVSVKKETAKEKKNPQIVKPEPSPDKEIASAINENKNPQTSASQSSETPPAQKAEELTDAEIMTKSEELKKVSVETFQNQQIALMDGFTDSEKKFADFLKSNPNLKERKGEASSEFFNQYGSLYAMYIYKLSGEQKKEFARKALEYYKTAYSLNESRSLKIHIESMEEVLSK